LAFRGHTSNKVMLPRRLLLKKQAGKIIQIQIQILARFPNFRYLLVL
jgi:hypothetical protein